MNNQVLFSSKDKSKKLKCRLLQFLFGALRVRVDTSEYLSTDIGVVGTIVFFNIKSYTMKVT